MSDKKLSTTYKLLRKLGFNYSEEEYGQVSLWRVIKQVLGNIWRKFLLKVMDWSILEPILPHKLRPMLLKAMGCTVGHHVCVGDFVRIDLHHADRIIIEDNVYIASGVRLLCHKRDLSEYYVGGDSNMLKLLGLDKIKYLGRKLDKKCFMIMEICQRKIRRFSLTI